MAPATAPSSDFARRGSAAGMGAIALAAILWALAAAVARMLFDAGVQPLELAAARSIIAMAGLALVPAAWTRSAGPPRRGHIAALGLAIAMVNAAYYLAIDHLEVAVAVILQYTAPALVVTWIAIRSRKRPAREVVVAVLAVTAGVVLVSDLVGGDLGDVDLLGVTFGLASAVLFGAYTLLSEGAGRAYGPPGAMLRAFSVASMIWFVFLAANGWPAELFEPPNVPAVMYVGLAGTLAPFLLFVWGARRVAAERATIAATLEPVVAAFVAWVWLDQTLSGVQVGGAVLVIGAIVALQVATASPPIAADI